MWRLTSQMIAQIQAQVKAQMGAVRRIVEPHVNIYAGEIAAVYVTCKNTTTFEHHDGR